MTKKGYVMCLIEKKTNKKNKKINNMSICLSIPSDVFFNTQD